MREILEAVSGEKKVSDRGHSVYETLYRDTGNDRTIMCWDVIPKVKRKVAEIRGIFIAPIA